MIIEVMELKRPGMKIREIRDWQNKLYAFDPPEYEPLFFKSDIDEEKVVGKYDELTINYKEESWKMINANVFTYEKNTEHNIVTYQVLFKSISCLKMN